MNRWRRLAFYLMLNVLVSACTMTVVLVVWSRLNPGPVSFTSPLELLTLDRPATQTPEPLPALTPTLALAVYSVQEGDTLTSIAESLGVSVDLLMRLNGLNDPNALGSGQTILVPATPQAAEVTPSPTSPPSTAIADGPPIQIEIKSIVGAGALPDERVVIQLMSDQELSLADWRLEDNQGNAYVFPQLTLFEGGSVSVYTHAGADNALELFWGLTEPVWQVGETAVLRDPGGVVRAAYQVP